MAKYLQPVIAAGLISFLIYCLHFNLDISDEGYYLYHFQWGAKVVGFNFYHLIVSPIGALFDHLLIGYRYLNVLLVTGASLALYRAISKSHSTYWLVPLCAGLLYFNQIGTLSYNSVVLAGGALFLALVIGFLKTGPRPYHALLIGGVSFLVFSGRFGAGLLIFLLGIFSYFILIPEKRRALNYSLVQALAFAAPALLFYTLYPDYFPAMFKYIKVLSGVSHEGLLFKHFDQGSRYLLRSILVPIIFLVLTFKRPILRRWFLSLYIGWFVISYLGREFHFSSLFYYLSGLIIAACILEVYHLWRSRELKAEDIVYTLLPIITYITSAAGTNNNVMKSASFSFLLLSPCLVFVLRGKMRAQALLAAGLVIATSISVYKNQFEKAYGSPPRQHQVYVKSSLRPLKWIMIDEKMEKTFIRISNRLSSEGFERERDRLFVYPNIPGFASYLEAKALGASWNSDNYRNSDMANCYSIENDPVEEDARLFFLSCARIFHLN